VPEIPLFQVDAFATQLFGGNPAAVCPLEKWLDDNVLLAIAAENNLSETAFILRRQDGDYDLRWFTPTIEVNLCGHATLAAAHVVFHHLDVDATRVVFHSQSGPLIVQRDGDRATMDFPATPPHYDRPADDLVAELDAVPEATYRIREVHRRPYVLAVFADQATVAGLAPRIGEMRANVICTAPGDGVDFVSRFFAPLSGVDEDPVTGSAHCALAPYWAKRLGKTGLLARQISQRGGEVGCRVQGDRVLLTGKTVHYLKGVITLP